MGVFTFSEWYFYIYLNHVTKGGGGGGGGYLVLIYVCLYA